MVFWQMDVGKRVPFSDNPSGWYYWTSVYYLYTSDFPNEAQARLKTVQLDKLLCLEQVEIIHLRVHSPPGRGNIIYDNPVTFTTGDIPNPSGLYSLIDVARWHLYSDDGRRTYRLNRMPLRPDDIDGQELSASGLLRQQTSLNTLLAQEWCRNSYGELLTSGDVVRRLTMWQLRHGTKRRRRNPLA